MTSAGPPRWRSPSRRGARGLGVAYAKSMFGTRQGHSPESATVSPRTCSSPIKIVDPPKRSNRVQLEHQDDVMPSPLQPLSPLFALQIRNSHVEADESRPGLRRFAFKDRAADSGRAEACRFPGDRGSRGRTSDLFRIGVMACALPIGMHCATSLGAEPVQQASSSPQTRLQPQEIPWPAAPLSTQAGSSMQTAVESLVVFGDAAKPGLYSIMFRVKPGAKIPAHSHPDDRSCFVVSGVWYFGYGDRFSETALRALPAGSHYTEPANVNHFAATRRSGATAECTSIGPTGTVFAQPVDDPRP
jgi:quercetin dioxygenase-like cupin family protein